MAADVYNLEYKVFTLALHMASLSFAIVKNKGHIWTRATTQSKCKHHNIQISNKICSTQLGHAFSPLNTRRLSLSMWCIHECKRVGLIKFALERGARRDSDQRAAKYSNEGRLVPWLRMHIVEAKPTRDECEKGCSCITESEAASARLPGASRSLNFHSAVVRKRHWQGRERSAATAAAAAASKRARESASHTLPIR